MCKIPENDRWIEFVQEKSGGLWAQQRLVTLPAYVEDGPFLAERPAVRVGRAVQGNVREQDQGRIFVLPISNQNRTKKVEMAPKIPTGHLFRTHVLEIPEVLRQTPRAASLSCGLSAYVLVYESWGIYHEEGMSAELHVSSKRTKR